LLTKQSRVAMSLIKQTKTYDVTLLKLNENKIIKVRCVHAVTSCTLD